MNRKVNVRNYNITTIKTTVKEYRDFPMINSLHAFTDIFATQFVLFWIITSSNNYAVIFVPLRCISSCIVPLGVTQQTKYAG